MTPCFGGTCCIQIQRHAVQTVNCLTPKMNTKTIFRNVHNYLPYGTVYHPRRLESTATPLWQAQIAQAWGHFLTKAARNKTITQTYCMFRTSVIVTSTYAKASRYVVLTGSLLSRWVILMHAAIHVAITGHSIPPYLPATCPTNITFLNRSELLYTRINFTWHTSVLNS
jgi:hypothetical protein